MLVLMNGSAHGTSSGVGGNSWGDGKSLSLKVLTDPVEGAENVPSSNELDAKLYVRCSGDGRRWLLWCLKD